MVEHINPTPKDEPDHAANPPYSIACETGPQKAGSWESYVTQSSR